MTEHAARRAVRPYRILVTGSRDWTDEASVWRALADVIRKQAPADAPIVVVHGACPTGADRFAAQWCDAAIADGRRPVEADPHPAKWIAGTGHVDRSAGFRRNAEVVAAGADICLAFLNPCSDPKCTKPQPHPSHGGDHTASLAEKANIPVKRYTPDNPESWS